MFDFFFVTLRPICSGAFAQVRYVSAKEDPKDKLIEEQNSIMSKEIETYNQDEQSFLIELKQIVAVARRNAYRAINVMQAVSNWLIGQRIIEQEQHGKTRAEYGKHIIEIASAALTETYGAGYSATNIRNMRKFYLTFNNLDIQQTLPAELKMIAERNQQTLSVKSQEYTIPVYPQLSWSHYERLMRVENETARLWYMKEAAQQMWAVHRPCILQLHLEMLCSC